MHACIRILEFLILNCLNLNVCAIIFLQLEHHFALLQDSSCRSQHETHASTDPFSFFVVELTQQMQLLVV